MNDRLGDIRERRQEKESSTLYYFTRTPETTIVPGEVNQPQKLNIRHATELHAFFTVFVGRIFFSFFKFLDRHIIVNKTMHRSLVSIDPFFLFSSFEKLEFARQNKKIDARLRLSRNVSCGGMQVNFSNFSFFNYLT